MLSRPAAWLRDRVQADRRGPVTAEAVLPTCATPANDGQGTAARSLSPRRGLPGAYPDAGSPATGLPANLSLSCLLQRSARDPTRNQGA
jgi:hypothetical protein